MKQQVSGPGLGYLETTKLEITFFDQQKQNPKIPLHLKSILERMLSQ